MEQGEQGGGLIRSHEDLEVYRLAFEAAMVIFRLSRRFPIEERYSLTDQMRRSSRSVCANIAEAWRKRRYEGSFLACLNIAEGEAAETQTWLRFAVACEYLSQSDIEPVFQSYDHILGKLVNMINHPSRWLMKGHPPNPTQRR